MRRGLLLACLALLLACDPAPAGPPASEDTSNPAAPSVGSPVPPDTFNPAAPALSPVPATSSPARAAPAAPALSPVPATSSPAHAAPATSALSSVPADSSRSPDTPGAPGRALPPGPLELAFVGDLILGKYVLHGYASLVDGDADPFARVRELLAADLLVGNLETPLVRTRPARSPIHIGYRFGADQTQAGALARAGFDALSVANNHATDLLGDGLRQTPEVLRDLGIAPVGAATDDPDPVAIVTVERAGWRIGLVAATTYVNNSPGAGDPALPLYRTRDLPRRLLPRLVAARDDHDLLIVLLHWGQEFTDDPDDFQRVTARRLLDGGADLVIGHHPHVLQGIERHGHGLVAYSLGNFLFANTDERSRHSGVLRLRYEPGRRCPARASFHPVWLGPAPTYTPEPAGAPAPAILAQVQKASRRLRTPWQKHAAELVLTDFSACDAPPA